MLNNFFSTQIIFDFIFKIALIILAIIYLLYTLVVSKNVKIMTKTLDDKFNYLIIFISSLQVTAGLILLIFAIFLI